MPKLLAAVVLAALLSSLVNAQWNPSTGYIQPNPGVPKFDPGPWNSAYKLTFRNVPFNGASSGLSDWPWAPVGDINTPGQCSVEGFDSTTASTVEARTCFYKNNTDNTFDYWVKVPGLALQNANCYCYSLNRFEGDYCLPGTSQGGRSRQRYNEKMTCPALHQAMLDDGATQVSREQVLSGQPDRGHYITMMARPEPSCVPGHCGGSDFHAMRKDASGTWSYKLPHTPATDRDLEGKLIKDPEVALLPGHYLVCGYYKVEPAKMPLSSTDPSSGPLGDSSARSAVSHYGRTPSTSVDISPAPYNPDIDGVEHSQQRVYEQDLAWERKRGSKEYEDWKRKQIEALDLMPAAGSNNSSNADGNSAKSMGRRLKMMV